MTIIDNIMGRIRLRFSDRETAGNILGEALKDVVKKEDRKYCVVLGIPRGGIITAYFIARKLGCQFGIIIPRKLRAPHNEEIAIGAITEDGTNLNDTLVKEIGVSSDYIAKEKLLQLKEIARRTSLYCSNNKSVTGSHHIELHNKTVILADDGAATGATLVASTRYVKSSGEYQRIIIAIPIAPKGTLTLLKSEDIDHIEEITAPDNARFKSVEQYYQDFHQVTDEVIDTMARWHHSRKLKN